MNDAHDVPFGKEEYEARVSAVRDRMTALGLEALLLTSPEDIYYLTGLNHQGYFALTVLVVPPSGEPVLIARQMEAATIAAQAPTCRHVPFEDHEQPADTVVAVLRALPERVRRMGLDKAGMWFPMLVSERLIVEFPDATFEDASPLVAKCRDLKSEAELDCVRRAAELTSLALQAGIEAIAAGGNIRDVAKAVNGELIGSGSEYPGFVPLIRFRDMLLLEHTTWRGDRVIQPGDAIFIELSASVERYHAPMSRMVYVGEPPPGTDVAAKIASDALDAVTAALVPGTRCLDVYAAWQSVVDESLGHDRYRRHHCGYMVGIGFPPSWVGGPSVVGLRGDSDWLIQPGMTFHVLSWLLGQQPADYVLSDTVVVTPDGGEIVTAAARQPVVVDP